MNAKFYMCQYVIFNKSRNFESADILKLLLSNLQGKNLFLGEQSFPVSEFTPIEKGSENEANSLPCKITLLL